MQLLGIHINADAISYPGSGSNGYIIDPISSDDLRVIQQIHYDQINRFMITPDMARALYTRINELGASEQLRNLSNEQRPDKLSRALVLLGIQYDQIAFNQRNGYRVYLPESEQAKINNPASITQLTEPLIVNQPTPHQGHPPGLPLSGHGLFAAPAPVSRTISIKAVQAYRPLPAETTQDVLETVQLRCPEHILHAFQTLIDGTPILGASFTNPYTGAVEQFPSHADALTARHLQILARNEAVNTTGHMQVRLYNGLLSDDQIARLRALVKATTVSGIFDVAQYGGYFCDCIQIDPSARTIIVDQAGLQWQQDLGNTGGLFFYPNAAVSEDYTTWQSETFRDMYCIQRPAQSSQNSIDVHWLGHQGVIDLDLVSLGIQHEFLDAFQAVLSQGETLPQDSRINFKFLKAGMGFFASGLDLSLEKTKRLERARLQGIHDALIALANQVNGENISRALIVGRIAQLELPFSGSNDPESIAILRQIEDQLNRLDLSWGGTPNEDALMPRPGYINATTNCGDPHAMPGNEGGYQSVDAAIATNVPAIHRLNAAVNPCMHILIPSLNHDDMGFVAASPLTSITEDTESLPSLDHEHEDESTCWSFIYQTIMYLLNAIAECLMSWLAALTSQSTEVDEVHNANPNNPHSP